MSDFKTKIHQIRFRLGLRPDPTGGAYSVTSDPLAGIEESTYKGRESKGEKGQKWEVRGGEGGDGNGGEVRLPIPNSWIR